MISSTTKIQLLIFAIVTVIGATIVGGKYAQLDRLVVDRTYPVKVELKESGGIFAGAEVTYRGIPIGKVGSLEYTANGVRATLDIEKSAPKMSQDTIAIVANKSAIGEQFMDLQPRSDRGPYLQGGSVIPTSNTVVPLDATDLLIDVGALVDSVDTKSLQTVINEVGIAFAAYGKDLGVIIDTFTSFIKAANAAWPETQSLIRGSNTVLQTLVDKRGQFTTLTENLTDLTGTLVKEDKNIRKLLDKGPGAGKEIGAVVQENTSDLASIFNSLGTLTGTLDTRWKSLESLLIIFPWTVAGSYGITNPAANRPGEQDGSIGLQFLAPGETEEQVCLFEQGGSNAAGYRARRNPDELAPMPVEHYDCLNPDKVARNPGRTVYNYNRAVTAPASGEDSWKWLLLGTASN
jgi:phospholipid/cholesterol/gamma-HCH transport system substrate-binding protein